MDPRLLEYYNSELHYIREMGSDFAKRYPKIAGRLGLDEFECTDPYVERLLEGFGFLAARIQYKLDAEFPTFTQHLLEMVYPHYLAPTPSMAVVQFQPDLTEGALAEGFPVPRQSALRSLPGKGEQTPCEFRTSHDVTLWPLEVAEAEYITNTIALPKINEPHLPAPKAAFRLRLRTTAGLTFDKLSLEDLPVYLRGSDELPMQIYEQILGNSVAMVVRSISGSASWQHVIDRSNIRRVGFDENEAMLPCGAQSFSGYRLLHEYFAFPSGYLFVDLTGLGEAMRSCTDSELEIFILLDRINPVLEHKIDASAFALFCSTAINLFPKRADRIHLNTKEHEYHVVPDLTRPMDFEVYQVTGVVGHGTGENREQAFLPFYSSDETSLRTGNSAYYTARREARLLSIRQQRYGPRSNYVGSEVFVSLVDAGEAPYSTELRQLAVTTLCTNRDLPLHMPVGLDKTDFTLESGAPVDSVRCLVGPSKPKRSYAEGDTAWRLISHLSLNYLSIVDSDDQKGATALRELLTLYGYITEAHIEKQIEGILSVAAVPITRRMPITGPITFGRGLEVTVTMDEDAFVGTGCFLLGAILEDFFAKYVSINSFTETVIKTERRGEIMRWPVRIGRRQML
ncbi:MAG: type VI secretion system baseplate subunit TssF [Gammaproteobacteria bacterium]|nr:type VI secretion system baseplate subunit TssF [Gammaproteobacteria bacterium]